MRVAILLRSRSDHRGLICRGPIFGEGFSVEFGAEHFLHSRCVVGVSRAFSVVVMHWVLENC
jgi:hypothetical protein